MITARAGALAIRGNKTNKPGSDTSCPVCGGEEEEDETHLLIRCTAYSPARTELMETLEHIWGQDMWDSYSQEHAIVQRLILLGKELEGETQADRRDRDLAAKSFLEEIDRIRTEGGHNSLLQYSY
jgi:hypothetical protein